ncbi:MAG: guanylate kinase [Acidobacteria bacterium]|nr:guanylate kinase [Acidobacteriota bacterium]
MSSDGTRAAGELFIVSAPSGTGKTTVIRRLLAGGWLPEGSLEFSISHTTRAPRDGEADGADYYFVGAETFDTMVREDAFLEWAEVYGNRYGTSREEVDSRLRRGADVLLEIDVQGARQVVERAPGAHGILIVPPSYAELERRLRGRDSDAPEAITRRLGVSASEIRCYEQYDYVIINLDAERAAQAVAAIILEKRHRLERMRGPVEAILREFPPNASRP